MCPKAYSTYKAMMNRPIFPAEWYPQSGVQLTWPHANTDWADMLEEVQQCFVEIAREIAKREILLVVTPEVEAVKQQLASGGVNEANVRYFCCVTNDTWARDHGGITILENGGNTIVDFKFNGWGLKFAAHLDNLITSKLVESEVLKANYRNALNFAFEGGSIESDGEGTLLTTSECLLSPNRNGGWSKERIETYLKEQLGAEQMLWLDFGYLAGDDTDSHIDTLARLAPNNTILYVECNDSEDEHYEQLLAMKEQLATFETLYGKPYRLIALPMADAIYDEEGERLPATYANYLVVNGAVLYPTYAQPTNDHLAAEAIAQAFPTHEIVGIDCRALIKQHGSLHCVTMQYPTNVLI